MRMAPETLLWSSFGPIVRWQRRFRIANDSDSEVSSSSEEEENEEAAGAGKGRSKLLSKAKAATFEALQFDEEADAPKTGLFALPFMVSITTF